ncbi:MAG: dodecin family protein [Acetobacteraceae bacterium]|nr:dodecin family protein [Acetobacteraceae bacterium]
MGVVKVLELVGGSRKGWQDAAENAVAEAARTVRNITGVEIANLTANVDGGKVVEYKANVKVAFIVDDNR